MKNKKHENSNSHLLFLKTECKAYVMEKPIHNPKYK